MSLQTIGHYVFPASIRDIGTGVYHLAKGDATEEQFRKLVAATLRRRNLYSFNWNCRDELRNSAMRFWRVLDSARIL